ncbi:MAG: DUF4258 domain-containing protein [Deltaproteobacteria bacterium]|nr:DUF4258 domain-containing protein [Deltaproteobacteria bacterium]
MNMEYLKNLAFKNRIAFKRHTLLRMYQRNIRAVEIKEILQQGQILEKYPTDKPLPTALLMGYTSSQRPLHVVVALDEAEEWIWIITVYEPDKTKWEEGFRKRRPT